MFCISDHGLNWDKNVVYSTPCASLHFIARTVNDSANVFGPEQYGIYLNPATKSNVVLQHFHYKNPFGNL